VGGASIRPVGGEWFGGQQDDPTPRHRRRAVAQQHPSPINTEPGGGILGLDRSQRCQESPPKIPDALVSLPELLVGHLLCKFHYKKCQLADLKLITMSFYGDKQSK
jgi:hypothetical protein